MMKLSRVNFDVWLSCRKPDHTTFGVYLLVKRPSYAGSQYSARICPSFTWCVVIGQQNTGMRVFVFTLYLRRQQRKHNSLWNDFSQVTNIIESHEFVRPLSNKYIYVLIWKNIQT
jgi:hypothetical protein